MDHMQSNFEDHFNLSAMMSKYIVNDAM